MRTRYPARPDPESDRRYQLYDALLPMTKQRSLRLEGCTKQGSDAPTIVVVKGSNHEGFRASCCKPFHRVREQIAAYPPELIDQAQDLSIPPSGGTTATKPAVRLRSCNARTLKSRTRSRLRF